MKNWKALALNGGICLAAALLILSSLQLPLWDMQLVAPQYPMGLHIIAYGDRVGGDLREVNILNQYIGMREISEHPAPEMALFPWSIYLLLIVVAVAPLNRFVYRAGALGAIVMPLGILADMQMRLRWFGQHLDHDAPIRLKPFTPLVLGPSKVGQFMTTARLENGGLALLAAGLLMLTGLAINRWVRKAGRARINHVDEQQHLPAIAASIALLTFGLATSHACASSLTLQQRIDAAPAHSTIVVPAGNYMGRVIITRSLTLIGQGFPTINGLGHGSVVTIEADDVTLRGFIVINSGRNASEEAAGVTVRGNRNVIENNDIHDVHFGIHAMEGEKVRLSGNTIRPGRGAGYRGGDGINLWSVTHSVIRGNRISDTRDGIYLSFTSGLDISGNDITRARYAIHSMFSQQVTIERNRLHACMLGAALMNSDSLLFQFNRVEEIRAGSTPYGVLLKDIGDLRLVGNRFFHNRVAIYADGTPDSPDHQAIIRDNVIIGNEVAFTLQNSVRLTVTGNSIIDNVSDVVSEGGSLSEDNHWSLNGRGNFWSEYRGFDRDGDGIGEIPFRVDGSFDYLLQRNPLIRAFMFTPVHRALEFAARMFPLFRADPLVIDPSPLMRPANDRKELS